MTNPEAIEREIAEIRRRAERYVYPWAIDRWLDTPNAAFGGRTMRAVVADGDKHLIDEMFVRLEEGIVS